MKLTKTDQATLRAIAEHMWKRGYPPTHCELSGLFQLSRTSVRGRFERMLRKGLIEKDRGVSRGIRFTDAGFSALAWSPPLYIQRAEQKDKQ